MNLDEYVVLRVPEKSTQKGPALGPGPMAMDLGRRNTRVKAFGLTSATLSRKEVTELQNDKEHQIAALMPMLLHKPENDSDIDKIEEGCSWGIGAVGAIENKWNGAGVKVAVLDTGIDATHPAFDGVALNMKDFTKAEYVEDSAPDDHVKGHGTHVAATIFGRDIKGFRLGVAQGVREAIICKVLDKKGSGTTKGISDAIRWAHQQGANIISMSLGIDFPGMREYLREKGYPREVATSMALERYRENVDLFNKIGELIGVAGGQYEATILLAAAGNESRTDVNPDHEIAATPPAAASQITAVGALGQSPVGLVAAPFSNTNVAYSAPGVDIISAKVGGGLKKMDGTSMATPHVAGVAALWAQKLIYEDNLNNQNLHGYIVANTTTKPIKKPVDRRRVGAGLVQAPNE